MSIVQKARDGHLKGVIYQSVARESTDYAAGSTYLAARIRFGHTNQKIPHCCVYGQVLE